MRERRLDNNPFPRNGVIFLEKIRGFFLRATQKGRNRMSLEPNRKNQKNDVLNQNEKNGANNDEADEIVIVIRGGNIVKFEHRKSNVS